jgi:hypothetical protein
MWMIWIVVAMASLAGVYSAKEQVRNPPSTQLHSADLAVNMAAYRAAVVAYASNTYASYPITATSVSHADLAPYLPYWYTPAAAGMWNNYIDTDGTIVIFATANPPVVYTADMVSLSQNSMLAGTASATGMLVSPIFGDTGIVLPKPGGALIPAGRPVWLARGT